MFILFYLTLFNTHSASTINYSNHQELSSSQEGNLIQPSNSQDVIEVPSSADEHFNIELGEDAPTWDCDIPFNAQDNLHNLPWNVVEVETYQGQARHLTEEVFYCDCEPSCWAKFSDYNNRRRHRLTCPNAEREPLTSDD